MSDDIKGLRDKLGKQGEEALGRFAQDLLENPLVSGALTRAFEARERAVQAQEAAMGALNIPSAADIERLTRRLRSVAPAIYLESAADVVLAGVSVPRGTWLVLLTRLAGMSDAQVVDRPLTFLPERWLESKSTDNLRASVPFGSGQYGPSGSIQPTAGLSIAATENLRRGFVGMALRPNAYEWRLLEERPVLAPLNAKEIGYPEVPERNYGPSGLSVGSDTWDVRQAVVIEGRARNNVVVHEEVHSEAPLSDESAWSLLSRDRYLWFIAGLVVLLNWVNSSGEYLLDRTVVAAAHDVAAHGGNATTFIGAFNGP